MLETFQNIDETLQKHAKLRAFRDYLNNNKKIIPELNNVGKFKEKVWISYLKEQKELYKILLVTYRAGKETLGEIVAQAKKEETDWKDVVDVFNKRFFVPFKLKVENQADVILKQAVPSIVFQFEDLDDKIITTKAALMTILSSGEERALYILNIMFDVEARKKERQKTLFIVDDIADSFDYKNKYAIIAYLNEISLVNNFYQIILTHNFDFHRTVSGRLHISSENRLIATKKPKVIELAKEKHQNGNPFSNWKSNFVNNNCILIASIPFVRNLAEYCGFDDESLGLTAFLHIKQETPKLKMENLEDLFKAVLKDQGQLRLPYREQEFLVLIFELAGRIGTATHNLENKIVLSIAIRLKAEQFMIAKINDETFVNGIENNQTIELINRFKKDFEDEKDSINVLEEVNLMTPENIHLNSFMYEPILDMSINHLKQLYDDVTTKLL